MRKSIFWLAIWFVCSMAFWLSACANNDDDNDGGGSYDNTLTSATMDQTTAENTMALVLAAGDLSSSAWSWLDYAFYPSAGTTKSARATSSLADWAVKRVETALLSANLNGLREGDYTDTVECISGSYVVCTSWTGSENPSDICDLGDLTLTLTFDQCVKDNETVNGTIKVLIGGDTICSPLTSSVSFTSFSVTDDSGNTLTACEDFQIGVKNIEVTEDNLSTFHVTTTMNGDIEENGIRAEFFQYSEDITVGDSDEEIVFSGSLTDGCIDGWVTVTTIEPVIFNLGETCPIAGQLKLYGASDITVAFENDASLVIGEEEYASCGNLPEVCQ